MAFSYPILPSNPSGSFHLNSLQFSSSRIVINPLKRVIISNSAGRQRSSRIQAVQSGSSGGGLGGAAEPSLPVKGWFFGSFFFSAIHVIKNILSAEDYIEKTLEAGADTLKKAAEQTEEMAEEFEASLPEGEMKERVRKIEKTAETVYKEAEAAQEILEKVDKFTDKLNI